MIIPRGLNGDSDLAVSRYFLLWQTAWIFDDSPMRLAEKSVRIGWTYGDGFKNVRKRLRNKKRDYLFQSKDYPTALEYLKVCEGFCDIFNWARSIVSRGEEVVNLPHYDDDGKQTGFTEEVKIGRIVFDNGSRILAFSSNPYALQAYGGDVGLDEFAGHRQQDQVWSSAQGRITWGFDLGVWSRHCGDATLFYQFAREAAAGKGGWSYYRVTMEDAVANGLVEKINQVSGKNMTREQFIADCKRRARLPEIYEEQYMCNPKGGTAAIVPWNSIAMCSQDYAIERLHFEGEQIKQLFGEYAPQNQTSRERMICNAVETAFASTFQKPAQNRLGFDVAASG